MPYHVMGLVEGDGLDGKTSFNDNFDDARINTNWTLIEDAGTITETNGVMRHSLTASLTPWTGAAAGTTAYHMIGDFDISVDVDGTGIVDNADGVSGQIRVTISGDNFVTSEPFIMGLRKGTNDFIAWSNTNTSFRLIETAPFNQVAKFRITRVGTTLTSYYDTGGGWVSFSSTTWPADPAVPTLSSYPDDSGSSVPHVIEYDNFVSTTTWQKAP